MKSHSERHTDDMRVILWLIVACTVGLSTGCSFIKELPIAVTYRESMVDNGLVIIITNASEDETLTHLGIRVRLANGEKRETVLDVTLTPGETVEAGWLELMKSSDEDPASAAIAPGTTVEIFAHGYRNVHRFTLPGTP